MNQEEAKYKTINSEGYSEKVEDINPQYPTAKFGTGMPINVKNVVTLIQQHALNVVWEQAMRCPCIDPQTGQPQPDCSVCHGQGWVYLHPRSIDMAMYSDAKKFSLNVTGQDNISTSLATPQITINSVEQGIKPGDRITVTGWTTNETYTFNVNQQRLNHGLFIPYKVRSINEAYYIDDSQKLAEVDSGALELNDNWLEIKDDNLLGKTISLSLEVIKRFYVVAMNKELRYQNYQKLADKEWALGNGRNQKQHDDSSKIQFQTGNVYVDQGPSAMQNIVDTPNVRNVKFPQVINRDGARIVDGKHQIYRLPPQLLLRRENLYFSNLNLATTETDNHAVIKDPRVTELNEFLGND